MLVLVLTTLIARGVSAQEDEIVKEALDRVIKVIGDEKNQAGIGSFTMHVKGKVFANGEVIDFTGDWSMRGLDRFRWKAQANVKGTNITSRKERMDKFGIE